MILNNEVNTYFKSFSITETVVLKLKSYWLSKTDLMPFKLGVYTYFKCKAVKGFQ